MEDQLNVTKDQRDNLLLIALNGRLDSTTAPAFEQQLMNDIEQGQHHLVFDCQGLEYISSAGLRVFLMAVKRVKAQQGALAVSGLSSHIREVFEISGFVAILNVVDDLEQAIALCQGT